AGRINRQSHDLYVSALELRLYFCHVTELSRADWCEVFRVREQNRPGVADPIMEVDPALGGFCFKIRRCIANFHLFSSSFLCEPLFQIFQTKSMLLRDAGVFHCAMSSQNLLRSMLPPETIATIGPLPTFLLSAAASGNAPAPSEMIRAFSAMNRIACFVS